MSRYRKRPVEIDAVQWTGGDYKWLNYFAGLNWGRADAHDVEWNHEDGEQIVVWNTLEQMWIPVPVGHWVIRGVRGELYPCEPAVFAATYEPVSGDTTGEKQQ
jgi:hypothetical protein